jgi:glyoxalase superfamily protein
MASSALKAVCFDCVHPSSLARWWAETLGYRVRAHSDEDLAQLRSRGIDDPEDDPEVAVDPVDGDGPVFWFNRVPEPKTVKNRVHVDVYVSDRDGIDALVSRGATLERAPDDVISWFVMRDPEENEFCAFVRA